MKNKFMRSVTAMVVAVTMLISSQGVVTSFADGGDHSDMSESSSVQMNEVGNNGTNQPTENGTGEDAAVKDVVEMINALPAAETITKETNLVSLKDQVNAARAAYDELSDDQKAAFNADVLGKLTALEAKISELESNDQETKPSDAVQTVVDAINALPAVETITEETDLVSLKDQVNAARAAYDALSAEQKESFDATVLEKLTALEAKISELESGKQETAPSEAVQNVIEKIDAAVEQIDYTTETISATDGTTVTKRHITMLKDLDPANNAELKALIDKEAAHEQDETQPALTDEEAAKLSDARKVFEDAKAKYLSEGFSDAQLAARQAYDALAEAEKPQVTNYSLLTAMEENIAYIMQAVNTLPESNVITENMTQEEVDAILQSNATVTIEPGNYGIENEKKHITLNLTQGHQTINLLSGEYNRLMITVLSEENILNSDHATIYGDVSTVFNQSPAIYVPYGSINISGNLTIDEHDYGIILGYTNATSTNTSAIKLTTNSTLNILNCKTVNGISSYDGGVVAAGTDYFSYVDTQGDGTRGSGITSKGQGTVTLNFETNSSMNVTNCSGSGMFFINSSVKLELNEATIHLDSNTQGICMNTDFASDFTANLYNSNLTCDNNKSNGITGQNRPYLFNLSDQSTLSASYNSGIGINSFYIIVDNSTVTVNNNKSHGATNISMTAISSPNLSFSNNAYIGLNITKLNDGEQTTRIESSTINANNNGGPGIRFYKDGSGTTIQDSIIYANGNGHGEDIYGYPVNKRDSGYFAGIVGKDNVDIKNSVIISDNSATAYSLYDTSSSSAALYVDGTDIIALNGTSSDTNIDIFDDYNSSNQHTGRTIVAGGSLQAEFSKTHGADKYNSWNLKIPSNSGSKDTAQYSAPVNNSSTALVRFDLHQSINREMSSEINTFTYYDPNTQDKTEYTFRYNKTGEDLDSSVSGNAYVWAPVSILHYDATEGQIDETSMGTAGELQMASSNTKAILTDKRYVDDITIYGNSLNLAEKTMPTAKRNGYVFVGWYVADDEEKAEKLAGENNFTELYKLLNTPFTQSSKISTDLNDVSKAQEEKTIYAKWKTPDPTDPDPIPDPDPTPRPGGGGDEDDDTPTIINDTPVPTTTIDDEDVPLTDLPEDTVTIDDEEVPLKDIPNTGDMIPVPAMVAAVISIGGIALLMKKHK